MLWLDGDDGAVVSARALSSPEPDVLEEWPPEDAACAPVELARELAAPAWPVVPLFASAAAFPALWTAALAGAGGSLAVCAAAGEAGSGR